MLERSLKMARNSLKFDRTNSLKNSTPKTKNTPKTGVKKGETKIVGIKIDTKSTNTKDKVYYYKTNADLKRGDRIRVKVPSGGSPQSTVAIQNSSKEGNFKNLIIQK